MEIQPELIKLVGINSKFASLIVKYGYNIIFVEG